MPKATPLIERYGWISSQNNVFAKIIIFIIHYISLKHIDWHEICFNFVAFCIKYAKNHLKVMIKLYKIHID